MRPRLCLAPSTGTGFCVRGLSTTVMRRQARTAGIVLAPQRKDTVRFTLAADDLAFLGPDLTPRLEPGTIELLVGRTAQRETALKTSIRLTGATAILALPIR